MIPKPKSEAWLLCAVKDNPYQHCHILENESGNDKGPNPLKQQLSDALQADASTEQLNDMVKGHQIDVHRIDMPSFNAFKDNLRQVVKSALGLPWGIDRCLLISPVPNHTYYLIAGRRDQRTAWPLDCKSG